MKPIRVNNFCKMKPIPTGDRTKTKPIPIGQEIPKLGSTTIFNTFQYVNIVCIVVFFPASSCTLSNIYYQRIPRYANR